jgi:photosystem II stability/assembly factor-like uncharacterized protein
VPVHAMTNRALECTIQEPGFLLECGGWPPLSQRQTEQNTIRSRNYAHLQEILIVRSTMKFLVLALFLFLPQTVPAQQQFTNIGPEGGLVVSMVATSIGAMFLGTADGHIFASEDGSAHWELRGRVGARTDGVVGQIVATPPGKTLFAAVWYREAGAGGGVFRSDDDGRTWSPAGLEGHAVRALELSPTKDGELFAGTRTGVFHSLDSGRTWQRISPADNAELQNIDSLAVDPHNPAILYAGTYHLPWKTADGGSHWQVSGTGMIDDSDVMSLRVDTTNPSRLYLSACSGIYRSENRGDSWSKLQGIPYGSRRTQAIMQDRDNPNTLFAATTQGLWLTRDAGENWKRTTPPDWVINSVLLLPAKVGSKQKVVIGTEGQGILVSEDAGETFTPSNTGFRHVVGRQLAADPLNAGHLLLVTEQGETRFQESYDSGAHWNLLSPSVEARGKLEKLDLGSVAEAYGTRSGWLLELKSEQIFLLEESSSLWKEIKLRWKTPPTARQNLGNRKKPTQAASKAVALRRVLTVSHEHLFVATLSGMARCDVSGDCQQFKAFAKDSPATGADVSPDENLVLVLASGKLGISRDGGSTAVWSDLPGAATPRWVRAANNGTRIFLGTQAGLYVSTNDGGTWTLVQHGLPPTGMQFWLEAGDQLFVSTNQGGLYLSRDSGGNWTRLNLLTQWNGITALAELPQGRFALGSLSEGALAWEANSSR